MKRNLLPAKAGDRPPEFQFRTVLEHAISLFRRSPNSFRGQRLRDLAWAGRYGVEQRAGDLTQHERSASSSSARIGSCRCLRPVA